MPDKLSSLKLIALFGLAAVTLSCGSYSVTEKRRPEELQEMLDNAPEFGESGSISPDEDGEDAGSSSGSDSGSGASAPVQNPEDGEPEISPVGVENQGTAAGTAAFVKNPGEIRVKIFPHQNKYVSPHGREARPDRVVIQSKQDCTLRDKAGTLSRGKKWSFSTVNLKKTVTIECESPVEVRRGFSKSGGLLPSRSYAGKLEVSPKSARGKVFLQIVNRIDHEEYLKGVVPAEMPARWGEEALKVQTVAARTYSLHRLEERRKKRPTNEDFDLDDTVSYQAYKGLTGGHKSSDAAVEKTKGEVVLYKGRLIRAYFSADAGGYTESAKNLWGMNLPYTVSKKEPFSVAELLGTDWKETVTKIDIAGMLKISGLAPQAKLLPKISILPSQINSSGRVHRLQISSGPGSVKTIPTRTLEERARLKSRMFRISSRNPTVVTGRGFGHGVGLSQYGAKILVGGKYRWSYKKVLEFYYENADVVHVK